MTTQSVLTGKEGIPFGMAIDGANRNDSILLAPTLDDAAKLGLLKDIVRLRLDRDTEATTPSPRLSVSPSARSTIR